MASNPGLLIPNAMARRGLRVRVLDGFGTRGAEPLVDPVGMIAHWTAGPRFTGNYAATPSLKICTDGSSRGLPNALCNTYGPRDGSVVVVAARTAWHGGVGSYRGISGNHRWFGHEMEGAGPGDFTPEQLAAYPKIIAAFCDITGRDPATWGIGHDEYAPRRKIDIGAYMPAIRAEAARIWRTSPGSSPLATPPTPAEDEDMANVLITSDPRFGVAWIITDDLTSKTPIKQGRVEAYTKAKIANGGKVAHIDFDVAELDAIPSTRDAALVDVVGDGKGNA